MNNTYQIYLISDSTGETLDRIFIAIKAQFKNIKYKINTYSFTRTENQILKILSDAEKSSNSIKNSILWWSPFFIDVKPTEISAVDSSEIVPFL